MMYFRSSSRTIISGELLLFVAVTLLFCCSSTHLASAHGHHHYHSDHLHYFNNADELKQQQQQQQQQQEHGAFQELLKDQDTAVPVTTKEVRRFKDKVKLVTVRFSSLDDGYTTSADFTCNAEVTRVESLKSHYAPHGWHEVPLPEEVQQQQQQQQKENNEMTASKENNNKHSRLLLSELTPKELSDNGLARDSLSASQHDDAPLHAVAFDLPDIKTTSSSSSSSSSNDKKKQKIASFVHLFRDPRFERLHAGHYPVETKPTHHPGEQMPLPRSHPQHECHRKGQCSVDRVHYRSTSTESFWVPESVDELVLSCAGQHQKTALVSETDLERKKKNTKKNKKQKTQKYSRPPLAPPPSIFSETAAPEVSTLALKVHPDTARRQAQAQATAAKPEYIKIQEVGPPETAYSIVFLSGGYTKSERQMFIDNVTAISNMMMDPQMDLSLEQDTEASLSNIHRTCPFNRYYGFWNVYAVYQESNDKGASRPLKGQVVDNNLQCVHPAEIERAVSCDRDKAGALVEITPAPFKQDPERVVIISIVNTFIYGGSAIYIPGKMHFANFFNGFSLDLIQDKERMLSLVDHEIGHALGNLMDEYSVGVPEPTGRKLRNCQVGSGGAPSGADLQWADWLKLKQAAGAEFRAKYGNDLVSSPKWDLLTTPEAVCGFTNYYKPAANCMMNRLNDYFMCPVCREQSTMQLFKEVNFTYEFPRLPFRDQVLLVSETPSDGSLNTSSTIVLHLNRLVAPWNGFKITATLSVGGGGGGGGGNSSGDATSLEVVSTKSCPACIVLSPAQFALMPVNQEVKVDVTITDDTRGFILPEKRGPFAGQLNQKTFFRIAVVPDAAGLLNESGDAITLYNYSSTKEFKLDLGQVGVNESDTVPRYVMCLNQNVAFERRDTETAQQKNQSFCTFNLSKAAGAYEQPKELGAIEESLDVWAPIVLAIMAILFIALWVWAQSRYTEMANGRVRLIFKTELSGMLKIVRLVMQGAAIAFLVTSIVSIGISAYVYYNTSVLGKILVVIGIIIASILYLMAFFGYWAISSRSKKMLIVNAVVLAVPLGIGMWLLLTLNSLGQELSISRGWVADGLQNVANTTSTTAGQAPQSGWMDKLEEFWIWLVANHPSWACSFQGMLECSGYYTSCSGSLGSTATCPTGCDAINDRFFAPCQKLVQDYIVANYNYAVTTVAICVALLGGGLILDIINFILLWQEKKKARENINKRVREQKQKLGVKDAPPGQVDKYKSMFLLRSLDKGNRSALISEFKRIDSDGSGELSRAELAMFIHRALGHKPHPSEIEEVFEVADLDKNGTVSLREFLLLFGWSMEEMDSAQAPAQKRGMLQRVTSFAKGKQQPGGAGPAIAGAAAAGGGGVAAAARPMNPNAPPSRAPVKQQPSPEEVARMREEMRRRAATRFGDVNLFGPTGSPMQSPASPMNGMPAGKAPPMMVQPGPGGHPAPSTRGGHGAYSPVEMQARPHHQAPMPPPRAAPANDVFEL